MSFMKISSRLVLLVFAVFSWLHMLTETWVYFTLGVSSPGTNLATVFHALVWGSYSFLYLLPGLLSAALTAWLFPTRIRICGALAIIGTVACILFIHTDRTIYDLYSFHFNNFVINLITTPGGIESLGGGEDTYWTIGGIVVMNILIQTALWLVSRAICTRFQLPSWRWAVMLLVLAMSGERLIYGVSDIRNDGTILETAQVYPFYGRTRFRTFASKLGFKVERTENMQVAVDTTRVQYPLNPVPFSAVQAPPNIVILVAESLRWDRLTQEIMPNTWRIAQNGQHFLQHASSGNGTREGLFGMFYGLYGSYWSSFLHAQRSPLLMDRLQELGYQLDLRTSAKFSYPEFNKTLFAKIPLNQLHEEFDNLSPWERDQANASELIRFIEHRDPNKPFMTFFFLESTHARYDFPESAIIARPYLQDLNYGEMSRKTLAPHIHELLNRYTNAAHWVDQQVGRVHEALEKQGLMENTIFIVTGDHGEEFLEQGFWGHNSSFVNQQIHAPLVISIPGKSPQTIERPTNHMDIGTTLLQALGAPANTNDYSLGRNLFDDTPRAYTVTSDWHSIGIITPDMKYRIPFNARGLEHWLPTRVDDSPYGAEATAVMQRNQASILDAIHNTSKFSHKNARAETPKN